MVQIEHIAIWVRDLEIMRDFYEKYFGASSSDKYINSAKGFESYFLTFETGARIELMCRTNIEESHLSPVVEYFGFAHLAITAGDKIKVNKLTAQLAADGYTIVSLPRITGDGYFESVVLDAEGNRLEIVAE